MRLNLFKLIFLSLIVLSVFPVQSQEKIIRGHVKDQNGNPIVGASASVKGNDELYAVTDSNGYYEFKINNTENKVNAINHRTKAFDLKYSKNKLYLNPADAANFKINMYTMNGRNIFRLNKRINKMNIINLPHISSGIYILKLESNNTANTIKINAAQDLCFSSYNKTNSTIARIIDPVSDTIVLEKDGQIIEETVTNVDSLLNITTPDTIDYVINVYQITTKIMHSRIIPTNVKMTLWDDENEVMRSENVWIKDTINFSSEYWRIVKLAGTYTFVNPVFYLPKKYENKNFNMTLDVYNHGSLSGYVYYFDEQSRYVRDTLHFAGTIDTIKIERNIRFDCCLPQLDLITADWMLIPNLMPITSYDPNLYDFIYKINESDSIDSLKLKIFASDSRSNGGEIVKFSYKIGNDSLEIDNPELDSMSNVSEYFTLHFSPDSLIRNYKQLEYKTYVIDNDGNKIIKYGSIYVVRPEDAEFIKVALSNEQKWEIDENGELKIIQ